MTKKETAIKTLQDAQEELYDADQLLGNIRATKETREVFGMIIAKVAEADKLVGVALDNLA